MFKAKQGGEKPEARSGTAMTSVSDHRVVAFGGADDEDNDDDLASEFSDQMHFYDSKTNRWFVANVNSKDADAKRRPGPRMNAQMTVKGKLEILDDRSSTVFCLKVGNFTCTEEFSSRAKGVIRSTICGR